MATTFLILALAAGTWLMRALPLAVLSRIEMPEWLQDWLRLVPGAVLAASLAQALLIQQGTVSLGWGNPYMLAALPTFLVAWRTRNVLLTMLCGMVAFALLQRFLA